MHWLIDGHNLIGQMPNLRLDDPHDEEKLLQFLRQYRAKTGHHITVVFDPGYGYKAGTTVKQGGITVQFAPSGRTADQVIARRVRAIRNPQAYIVVSSDRAVQRAAQHSRVRVSDARTFAQQLLQTSGGQDQGSQTDVNLSQDEVDEWLDLFNQ